MSRSVLVAAGAGLTAGCLALLFVGYAPEAFTSKRPPLDVVGVAPKCDAGVKVEMSLFFQQPRFWAPTTGANLMIQVAPGCASMWLSTTNANASVRMFSTEAEFAGERRDVNKAITAAKQTGQSKTYEVDTSALNKHWTIVVENAFVAHRDGFDRYAATGVASLVVGEWRLKTASGAYASSGTSEWSMDVTKEDRPEDRDLLFDTGAVFSRITEYKDIFGILVSTVLGLGLSTLVQGLAMPAAPKRRKSSQSAATPT